MMIYFLYKLTRDDEQVYFGTTNEKRFTSRMNAHKYSDRFKGRDFTVEIVAQSEDDTFIASLEEQMITRYDTYNNGLNNTVDGKGNHLAPAFTTKGYKHSENAKRRMRKAKTGYVPWNKGVKGYTLTVDRRGKIHSSKLTVQQYKIIRESFKYIPTLPGVGKRSKNGVILTQERAVSKILCHEYQVSDICIYNILTGKTLR